MNRIARRTGIALAAAAMALTAAAADAAKPKLTPEQQLAKALEGRVAGAPVDCIYMPTIRSTQIYDKIAIVYDAGGTLYVQKPRVGAESLDNDDVLVTRLTSSQLCSIDTVHLVDRTSHFQRGFVGLDKFVPYTKPPKVAAAGN